LKQKNPKIILFNHLISYDSAFPSAVLGVQIKKQKFNYLMTKLLLFLFLIISYFAEFMQVLEIVSFASSKPSRKISRVWWSVGGTNDNNSLKSHKSPLNTGFNKYFKVCKKVLLVTYT
jgi:hypothetical protein